MTKGKVKRIANPQNKPIKKKGRGNKYELQHRDLSWLAFNRRVLDEAANPNVPLFERIKFLAIHSSNFDEFFSVRVPEIKQLIEIGEKSINRELGIKPKKTMRKLVSEVNDQLRIYSNIFQKSIIPELRKRKIYLYQGQKLRKGHVEFVVHYFKSKVLSFLHPVLINEESSSKIFLENGSPYFVIDLIRPLNGKSEKQIAILNIPSENLARFVKLPTLGSTHFFINLDDIVRYNLDFIFPGFEIQGAYSFKLNRDADLHLDLFEEDLMLRIKSQVEKRKIGNPARFVYDSTMPTEILSFLKKYFDLTEDDLVSGGPYRNLKDLLQLENPFSPRLENQLQIPLNVKALDTPKSIFDAIDKSDHLLHFPYQSYDYILQFFNEAAIDTNVTRIQIALYRIASNSIIVNALISAALNGKKVRVFIEAKARFDELNNIKWASMMEEVGIEIVYSLSYKKVHAKIALVERKKGKKVKKYALLGTGNFNEKTATTYADHSLLTCDKTYTLEIEEIFKYLFEKKGEHTFQNLFVAPFNMKERFFDLIDFEITAAGKGQKSAMILKMNNLEDPIMIEKIREAVDAGVEIDLIIRGICCMLPTPHNNLRIRRIIDRYLEHARIFYFHHEGKELIYMGSADWMRRNLYHRIEVVFPVNYKEGKQDIIKLLKLQLKDSVKAKSIDHTYIDKPIPHIGQEVRVQRDYYLWLKAKR